MPKPRSKEELLDQSRVNFKKMLDFIDALPMDLRQREFPKGTMNRNIRDVFAHIHHWHLLMLNWYDVGMQGKKPDMPSTGYRWKDTPTLNQEIWKLYQSNDLNEVRSLLAQSHKKIMDTIACHTDEELFEKRKYHWTGSTSLGAYFISNTSSHYRWGLQLIRKNVK
ncbi:ClbS/DfsB family four-helix bundle protein [Spongiimicrobium salis]|uniref:ClbS/DfsB family four-helix bundle protein n=1 Tax=Spongiimicrobium salis TaxID=1667022 RepID=UPI00374D8350